MPHPTHSRHTCGSTRRRKSMSVPSAVVVSAACHISTSTCGFTRRSCTMSVTSVGRSSSGRTHCGVTSGNTGSAASRSTSARSAPSCSSCRTCCECTCRPTAEINHTCVTSVGDSSPADHLFAVIRHTRIRPSRGRVRSAGSSSSRQGL